MSDKVVSLHGSIAAPSAAPVESLVQELERLLDAARSGEIIGFAGAYQHRNDQVGYSFAGMVGSYAMIGGVECLKSRLVLRSETA